MTAPALARGAHALPQKAGKPCWGRPGIFTIALVLWITLLCRGAPWHALALNPKRSQFLRACRTLLATMLVTDMYDRQ